MMHLNKELIKELLDKAVVSERKRINYDLRTSSDESSQRMLNALMPETTVPIHRHPNSNENVICICGKLVEILYEEDCTSDFSISIGDQDMPSRKRLKESARYILDPSIGNWGCVVPAGVWHTVEVIEPSIIYEAKDGRYGEDGSETLDEHLAKKV